MVENMRVNFRVSFKVSYTELTKYFLSGGKELHYLNKL